jgi:hypothetical protein
VLAVAVALRATSTPAAEVPTPTPPLVGAVVRLPPTPFSPPESPLAAAAAAPLQGSTPGPNTPASATPPATPTTRPPRPTAQPVLAAGDVIVRKPWHASLLRPEYAVLLDGAIGTFQPHGRFALALVAIGNDGAAPARIPGNFFALVDSQGKRYAALPAASTAYLNTYGRGQRGDLSLEENIPPGGGNVSVPLIFDVPTTARDLTLHVDDEPLGWAVGGAATAPAP